MRSRTPSLNGSLYSPYNSLNRKYGYQRAGSPGLILREYKSLQYPEDISRIYTYSYLTEEPTQGYLKRPIDPYDKPPTSPHFHRPSSAHSMRGSSKSSTLRSCSSRSGMKVLVDSIRSETPRPRSPHMNNEEPIELAHYPGGHPPNPGEKPKIERDDFPAPPYPYTDPERRRRWSDSYKGVPESDDEDTIDGATEQEMKERKLKKEEEELSKIASGIGKVFLQNVREREKMRQYKREHIDPRNASRTPNAAKEPAYRLRYQSPVNASPSRNLDAPRPWEEDELFDRSSSYRSSMGRSVGAIPSYNDMMSEGMVRKWVRMFNGGRTNEHDDNRSGRPSLVTYYLVRAVDEKIQEKRHFSMTTLSDDFQQILRTLVRNCYELLRSSQAVFLMGSKNAH
ncbi:Actin-binding LIM protein 3 [Homalodisca vitripennis]|nr:Actin-binding LIM protein 3 [Homalodisca vitripennis]